MKYKRGWQRLFLMLLLMIGCVSFLGEHKAQAAIHSVSDIGLYPSGINWDSVVGIRVTVDHQLVGYAVDTWARSGTDQWTYVGTNCDGTEGQIGFVLSPQNVVCLREQPSDLPRFAVNVGNLKNGRSALNVSYDFPQEYSVVYTKFQKGKIANRYTEYSYEDVSLLNSHEYSITRLIGHSNIACLNMGTYHGDGASYTYDIYSALTIGANGDIPVAAQGNTVNGEGKAFFNGTDYIIQSLPQVATEQTGYQSTFLGWFDQPSGGNAYHVGDRITKGTTLYLQISREAKQYPVTCIDLVKDRQIGVSQWTQAFDTIASGSQAGCLPIADTYYEGMRYTGCSTAKVTETDNVVYRYFEYADYPVTVIDIVQTGANQGKQLASISLIKPYQTLISGGELLGADTEEGAYHQGYQYVSDQSAVVGKLGTTVYRYFQPISYQICFVGNGATGGTMADITPCYYDVPYSLTGNSFTKKCTVSLDLQAEDAVCETTKIFVDQPFLGWADQPEGSVRYSDTCEVKNLLSQSGTKELYAVWDMASISIAPTPVRMGYQFAGWSVDPDSLQGSTDFTVTEDMTLYAVWKPNVAEYHVEYYKENAAGTFDLATQYEFRGYTGKEVAIEPAADSYAGYYLDQGSSCLSGIVKEDGSLILTAYFRRNTYSVTFDMCGGVTDTGKEIASLSGKFEETVQIPACIPTKKGYTFAGWSADQNGTQKYCDAGEKYHIPNHDQTLYAIWQGKTGIPFQLVLTKEGLEYENDSVETRVLTGRTDDTAEKAILAFYHLDSLENLVDGYVIDDPEQLRRLTIAGDGSTIIKIRLVRREYLVRMVRDVQHEEEDSLYQQKVRFQDSFILPKELPELQEVSYYQDAEGNIYRAGDSVKITKETLLMPVWKVTYDTGKESTEAFVPDKKVTLLLQPKETTYRFEGWYLDSAFEHLAGKASDPIEVTSNISLYAKWSSEKIVYRIQFERGDVNQVSLLDGEITSYCCGDRVVLPVAAQMLLPEGYRFVGWYEKSDQSHTVVRVITEDEYGDKIFCPLLEVEKTISSALSQNMKQATAQNKAAVQKGTAAQKTFTKKSIRYSILASARKKQVQVIGAKAGIKQACIPKTVTWHGVKYKVTKIKKKAFYQCKTLRTVAIGSNVKKIGAYAFAGAKKLRKIQLLGKSIRNMEKKAFQTGNRKSKCQVFGSRWKRNRTKLRKAGFRGSIIRKK